MPGPWWAHAAAEAELRVRRAEQLADDLLRANEDGTKPRGRPWWLPRGPRRTTPPWTEQ